MAGLGSLLNTARDALAAQSYALNVTGQNVANASTPGYVRREAILQTRGVGDQTTGTVQVAGLKRGADQFIDQRYIESVGLSSAAEERDSELASIEAAFNDTNGTGIGSSLNSLYESFGSLANNPQDPTARATVLDRAQTVVGQINSTACAITTQQQQMLQSAKQVAQQANSKAGEIAKLNQQIAMAESEGGDAADLKDERDQLLLGLAQLVDARTFTDAGGGLVVQAMGTTLVEGDSARTLSVDVSDQGQLRVLAEARNGLSSDVTAFVTGGKLGGIREARDQDLSQVSQHLDQLVTSAFGAINVQQSLGFDLNGEAGGPLFAFSDGAGAALSLRVDPSIAGQPSRIAAAGTAESVPGGGDNALALFSLARQPLADMGGVTPTDAYSALVGEVGQKRADSTQALQTRQAMQNQLETMRESVSGVNLDEEMVSLTKYQRAYEAGAKVLSTTDQLMQELLNIDKVG